MLCQIIDNQNINGLFWAGRSEEIKYITAAA
jgi:hypothetical protein